jgi:hypothetical protein
VASTEKSGSVGASLAGEDAAEDLLLALLTHAHVLLAYLVAATGISEAEWLGRARSDYVDRIPSSGTGVWARANSGSAADRRSHT